MDTKDALTYLKKLQESDLSAGEIFFRTPIPKYNKIRKYNILNSIIRNTKIFLNIN